MLFLWRSVQLVKVCLTIDSFELEPVGGCCGGCLLGGLRDSQKTLVRQTQAHISYELSVMP